MKKVIYLALAISLASCSNSQPTEPLFSVEATEKGTQRIEEYISKGYVTVETQSNKGYIDPVFWNLADVDQKKEIMLSFVAYTNSKTGAENKFFKYFDKKTGKQIAEWTVTGGYDFEY